ncbi:response regulator [Aeromonas enteropelogenes]|uniref:response regulator n=2 Tax=Aeromonas enteropelogenes TaxID=29489 RepID=UPI003BA17783
MPMTKTVLVVDDSASIRATITMTLENAGFSVLEADDGHEAMARLEQQRVHLIISDLNMPGMDGMTLLRQVKVQEATRYLPFIMLTTENSPQIRQEGFEAGARIWLTKPFEPLVLLDHIYKVVQP